MNKQQLLVFSSAIFLFCFLYFGLDYKPRAHSEIEERRVANAESTNINALLLDARKDLNAEQSTVLLALDKEMKKEELADTSKAGLLKQFSSRWFEYGHGAIAGYYAEQAAEIENTEQAWSIAGTSYTIGLQRSNDPKVREYCTGRALKAFENAVSMNPSNVDHRINLALVSVENPPADNPMKGILKLRTLNEDYPENVSVINNLARLAIRTNQFERAVERLGQALKLNPENALSNCLIAQAYEGLNDTAQAAAYTQKCAALRAKK